MNVEYLRTQFILQPDGTLINKVNRSSSAREGEVAGTLTKSGYINVSVKRKVVGAHRIVYALVYDKWPELPIDHIDGVRSNNHPSNLREASIAENTRNTRTPRSNNRLGVLGVSMDGNKFHARIMVNGTLHLLGNFSTLEEARAAYETAKRTYHPEAYTNE